MAQVLGQDRFFSGGLDSATPAHLIEEGKLVRAINCRFLLGAVTNAVGFDEIPLTYALGPTKRFFASSATYQDIFDIGDLQLLAPLSGSFGAYLVSVISGRLFLTDPLNGVTSDITPIDAFLADNSQQNIMSYVGNDGGTSGIGGTLAINNYPNRPIFINIGGARMSSASLMEMPPFRVAATAGNRMFGIAGNNVLWESDALGQTPLAPLTFTEVLTPSSGFYGDLFTIGSFLDGEYVTCMARLPKFLGPSSEFLAHNLYIFTENHRYIIAAGMARASQLLPGSNFIVYAGTSEGGAGPRAAAVVGSSIAYQSTLGRIKQISQDQMRDTGLQETFFDGPLGQYLNLDEHDFSFREWYQKLPHTYATTTFNRNRLYSTVYPFYAPAIDRFGQPVKTVSNRALAVASLDSQTVVGPTAHLVWEGFYDWFQPCLTVTLKNDFYVFAKDFYGKNTLLKQNPLKRDDHQSVIFTRGYFADVAGGNGRQLLKGQLYFRKIGGPINVRVSYLANGQWMPMKECVASKATFDFTIPIKAATSSYGIQLRIELDHKGCVFELESIRVAGETLQGF